jgi:hypothetical protein
MEVRKTPTSITLHGVDGEGGHKWQHVAAKVATSAKLSASPILKIEFY